MSRAGTLLARAALVLLACGLALSSPVRAFAQQEVIDAVGLMDFSGRPNFHVGSWVKYHTVGKSLLGHSDDYTTTLLIAGEEVAWGEPCVWIETWVDRGLQSSVTASLVSYAAFGDTMTNNHLGWFLRQSINGIDDAGNPDLTLATREENELKLRKVNWDQEPSQAALDTLGNETVTVPVGTYKTLKVSRTRAHGGTTDLPDSTIYYEQRIQEVYYRSREVPITSLVKMDMDDLQRGKSWAVGNFTRDSLKILERAQGSTTLVAMGRGDLLPKLVPPSLRKPIADRKLVEETMNQPMEPTMRTIRRGSSTR
jgi:hypothetical protein